MNEYQLSDLAASVLSNFLTTFTVFMSIVTAYVVAAFAALYLALALGSLVFMSNVRKQDVSELPLLVDKDLSKASGPY